MGEKPKYGTSFLESEAFLAASEADDEYVYRVFEEMGKDEIVRLMTTARHLERLCHRQLQGQNYE